MDSAGAPGRASSLPLSLLTPLLLLLLLLLLLSLSEPLSDSVAAVAAATCFDFFADFFDPPPSPSRVLRIVDMVLPTVPPHERIDQNREWYRERLT